MRPNPLHQSDTDGISNFLNHHGNFQCYGTVIASTPDVVIRLHNTGQIDKGSKHYRYLRKNTGEPPPM